jgi:hypothetical protein
MWRRLSWLKLDDVSEARIPSILQVEYMLLDVSVSVLLVACFAHFYTRKMEAICFFGQPDDKTQRNVYRLECFRSHCGWGFAPSWTPGSHSVEFIASRGMSVVTVRGCIDLPNARISIWRHLSAVMCPLLTDRVMVLIRISGYFHCFPQSLHVIPWMFQWK